MAIPFHSKIRRKLRTLFNVVLGKLLTPKQETEKLDPEKIKKILLIRLNYRIGNIIFMTPLIRALEQKLPNARIDLLVGASFTKPIVEKIPNIHEVYPVPRSLLKHPLAFYRFIKMLNQNKYDLIISPTSGSVSANIATFLIQAPYKLGISKPNTWLPFNITVPFPGHTKHEALKPLAVMQAFSGKHPEYKPYLDIVITKEEKEKGKALLIEKLGTKEQTSIIVGLFRDARNEKKISDAWWKDFVKEVQNINPDIRFIDILAPHETTALTKNMSHIASKNLRDLAAIFSALDAFVCADTGPMHLASASLTPTIALFNATDPSYYGPLGTKDKTVQINEHTLETTAKICAEHIRKVAG